MAKPKILVVEDNEPIREEIRGNLEQEGFDVKVAGDGPSALELAATFKPDLVILDIVLAGEDSGGQSAMDGIEVLRRLRERSEVAVLMLTETAIGYVKVAALTLGADDYLTKPFDNPELVARIRAILRRSTGHDAVEPPLVYEAIRIEPKSRRVFKHGRIIDLSPIEYDILYTLAKRPEQVFTRSQLLERAWKNEYYGDERVVDVHIGRLRKKVEDNPRKPTIVVTVRGAGYRFEDIRVQ